MSYRILLTVRGSRDAYWSRISCLFPCVPMVRLSMVDVVVRPPDALGTEGITSTHTVPSVTGKQRDRFDMVFVSSSVQMFSGSRDHRCEPNGLCAKDNAFMVLDRLTMDARARLGACNRHFRHCVRKHREFYSRDKEEELPVSDSVRGHQDLRGRKTISSVPAVHVGGKYSSGLRGVLPCAGKQGGLTWCLYRPWTSTCGKRRRINAVTDKRVLCIESTLVDKRVHVPEYTRART